MILSRSKYWMRPTALLLAASLMAPAIAGCGGHQEETNPPPITSSNPPKPGMSTGKKVVIALAGAALLYWLWKHHQQQNGQAVQYFRSKSSGRIYWRDPKNPKIVHYVTPDPKGYEVTPDEQQQIKKYQGYNNQATGDDYDPGVKDSGGGA